MLKKMSLTEKVETLTAISSKAEKLKAYAKKKLLNLHYNITTQEEVGTLLQSNYK